MNDQAIALPPFRTVPESTTRIMGTQAGALLIPAAVGVVFFGPHALLRLVVAVVLGLVIHGLVRRFGRRVVPGDGAHSAAMAMLVVMLLPGDAAWSAIVIGVTSAILVGKHLFGGLGHYVWHPALVGRLIAQLVSSESLARPQGPLLDRNHLLTGNLFRAVTAPAGGMVEWFTNTAAPGSHGFQLALPLAALRDWAQPWMTESLAPIARQVTEPLPPLEQCLIGAVPGNIGTTSALALVILGLFFIYRGYLPWQLPVVMVVTAALAAMFCPIPAPTQDGGLRLIFLPIVHEGLAVGLTYTSYHLVTGELLAVAMLFSCEMTSRPITRQGHVVFAAGIGILTILLRLYTPLTLCAVTAMLCMNTLVPLLDRWTRPQVTR